MTLQGALWGGGGLGIGSVRVGIIYYLIHLNIQKIQIKYKIDFKPFIFISGGVQHKDSCSVFQAQLSSLRAEPDQSAGHEGRDPVINFLFRVKLPADFLFFSLE